MRERGAWIGAVVGAVGILLVALELSKGGGYFVLVPHLAWAVPLVVVGIVTALAASRTGEGQVNAVVWLILVVIGAVAWNLLVYSFKFGGQILRVLVPTPYPTGVDFRDGLYDPGRMFSNAGSGWPPLTLWLGKAFTALSLSAGYVLQLGILACLAVAVAVLCGHLALRVAPPQPDLTHERLVSSRQLGLLGGLWLLTSYGFFYEMDRGQVDLYALVFALLAVWLVVRRPTGSAWWPSLSLALAINIKAYPAVLAVVLLWRYRWRAVVPLLVTDLVLFLSAGPANVQRFLTTQSRLEGSGSFGWDNGSPVSLGATLHRLSEYGLSYSWPSWLGSALLVSSAAVWIVTLLLLMRGGWTAPRAVLASAACFPVMCTFPTLSEDYKLVLLVFPLTVLASLTASLRRRGGPLWAVLFLAVAVEFFLLARSSLVIRPSLQGSKFALVFGLQLLLLGAATLDRRSGKSGTTSAETPPARDPT